MTDTALQRLNMVESQVRPSDITDRRIVRAMRDVAREAFVPPDRRATAYLDDAITVAAGATGHGLRQLLAPRTFAKLVQLAGIGDKATVLDIGCTTGYSTAVLARMARRIVGLEVDPALAARAETILASQQVANATIHLGPLADGHATAGPYDAIVLEGAVPFVPDALLDQLKDGGRLVAILTQGGAAQATMWQRNSSRFSMRPAFDAWGPALPGFEVRRGFVL